MKKMSDEDNVRGDSSPSSSYRSTSSKSSASRSLFDDSVPPPAMMSAEPPHVATTAPEAKLSVEVFDLPPPPLAASPQAVRGKKGSRPNQVKNVNSEQLTAADKDYLNEFVYKTYSHDQTELESILAKEAIENERLHSLQTQMDCCFESISEFLVWYKLEWDRKTRSKLHRDILFGHLQEHQTRPRRHSDGVAAGEGVAKKRELAAATPSALKEQPAPSADEPIGVRCSRTPTPREVAAEDDVQLQQNTAASGPTLQTSASFSDAMFGGLLSPTLSPSRKRMPLKLVDQASAILTQLGSEAVGANLVDMSVEGSPRRVGSQGASPVESGAYSPAANVSWALSSEEGREGSSERDDDHMSSWSQSPAGGNLFAEQKCKNTATEASSLSRQQQEEAAILTQKRNVLKKLYTLTERGKFALRDDHSQAIGLARHLMNVESELSRARLMNEQLEAEYSASCEMLETFKANCGYKSEAELGQQLQKHMLEHASDMRRLESELHTWKAVLKQAHVLTLSEERKIHSLEEKLVLQAEHRLRAGDSKVRLHDLVLKQNRLIERLRFEVEHQAVRVKRENALVGSKEYLAQRLQIPQSSASPLPSRRVRDDNSYTFNSDEKPNIDVFDRLTKSLPGNLAQLLQGAPKTSQAQVGTSAVGSPSHWAQKKPKVGDVWGRLDVKDR